MLRGRGWKWGWSYLHSLIWTPLNSGSTLVWGSKSRMWNTERLLLMYPVEQLWGKDQVEHRLYPVLGKQNPPGALTSHFHKAWGNGGLKGFCPV